MGIARSSYYYQPAPMSADNLLLTAAIDRLHTAEPCYGSRRILAHLPDFMGKEAWEQVAPVSEKRIRRLMKIMDIHAIYQKPNLSAPAAGHEIYPYLLRGVFANRPNHIWSCDITYIPMARGFMYLFAVMDWYTRFVLAWSLSNTLSTDFCLQAVRSAFKHYGCPAVFNTDQGSQFTSKVFLDMLREQPLQISMDGKGRAIDNVFIERLWRTVKYEHIYLHVYEDGKTLHKGLTDFFRKYNHQRRHQKLDYKTPAELYLGT